jgi:hypothetical protein
MTVLPTVRRQIEQAAQRQASAGRRRQWAPLRTAGAVTASPARTRRRARLTEGGVIAAPSRGGRGPLPETPPKPAKPSNMESPDCCASPATPSRPTTSPQQKHPGSADVARLLDGAAEPQRR